VVAEFAGVLKQYRITTICGDRYAGMWPRERFQVHGIEYRPSELTKSQIYLECLSLFTSGRVELLANKKLENELAGLERRTARGGRDSIDHGGRGDHDDTANSVCGALLLAASADRRHVKWSIATGISHWSSDGQTMSSSDSYWENMRKAMVRAGNKRHDGKTFDEVRIPHTELPPSPRVIMEHNRDSLGG